MPTILLNGEPFAGAGAPQTWGELLALADDHAEGEAHIVTDVRFDGIDEPAFREPVALERTLTDVAVIEVGTGTRASLLERCLGEAVASIPALCAAATGIGELFRSHDIEAANANLVELADGMGTLIAIAGAATLATKVEATYQVVDHEPINVLVSEMSGFLDGLIEAQHSQDWITVADVLQYDVEPALRRWQPVLNACSGAGAAA